MDKFIQDDEKIYIRPTGIDVNIDKNSIYDLKWDTFRDMPYLEKNECCSLPDTIYENEGDSKFMKKCITTFKNTSRRTTGVLLSGLKGSGKTLMSKQIAYASGVPIFIVDTKFPSSEVENFFSKLTDDYCIIFDEVEKNWATHRLLGFLDGLKTSCKKLVIFTCNNVKDLDNNLLNRCSRIRYHRIFNTLNNNIVKNVISEELHDKTKVEDVTNFVLKNFDTISFDNVMLFAEEVNNSVNETLEEIMHDLNLTSIE